MASTPASWLPLGCSSCLSGSRSPGSRWRSSGAGGWRWRAPSRCCRGPCVLTFGLPRGAPLRQQTIALLASLALLVSLSGRAMFERYEGNAATDWSGPRMGLVRWTIILNMASALGLFLFVVVYRYAIGWHVAIPAVLLAGLLARRTAPGQAEDRRPAPGGAQLHPLCAGRDVLRVAGGELYGRDLPLRRRLPARHHRRMGLPVRLRETDLVGVASWIGKSGARISTKNGRAVERFESSQKTAGARLNLAVMKSMRPIGIIIGIDRATTTSRRIV